MALLIYDVGEVVVFVVNLVEHNIFNFSLSPLPELVLGVELECINRVSHLHAQHPVHVAFIPVVIVFHSLQGWNIFCRRLHLELFRVKLAGSGGLEDMLHALGEVAAILETLVFKRC